MHSLTAHDHSVAASGDGSVKLWDVALGEGRPIKNFHEHEHEVYSVDWNLVNKAQHFDWCSGDDMALTSLWPAGTVRHGGLGRQD